MKRRIAQAVDQEIEVINLALLRHVVEAADAQGFRDDSEFQVVRDESFRRTFLVFNEVTP
jgi:hypothetical protein